MDPLDAVNPDPDKPATSPFLSIALDRPDPFSRILRIPPELRYPLHGLLDILRMRGKNFGLTVMSSSEPGLVTIRSSEPLTEPIWDQICRMIAGSILTYYQSITGTPVVLVPDNADGCTPSVVVHVTPDGNNRLSVIVSGVELGEDAYRLIAISLAEELQVGKLVVAATNGLVWDVGTSGNLRIKATMVNLEIARLIQALIYEHYGPSAYISYIVDTSHGPLCETDADEMVDPDATARLFNSILDALQHQDPNPDSD